MWRKRFDACRQWGHVTPRRCTRATTGEPVRACRARMSGAALFDAIRSRLEVRLRMYAELALIGKEHPALLEARSIRRRAFRARGVHLDLDETRDVDVLVCFEASFRSPGAGVLAWLGVHLLEDVPQCLGIEHDGVVRHFDGDVAIRTHGHVSSVHEQEERRALRDASEGLAAIGREEAHFEGDTRGLRQRRDDELPRGFGAPHQGDGAFADWRRRQRVRCASAQPGARRRDGGARAHHAETEEHGIHCRYWN